MTVPPPYLVLAPLAFATALVLTPLLGHLARRTGYLDHPDPRKHHREPTPLLGGLAIALALMVAPVLARTLASVIPPLPAPGVLLGAALSLILGLIDDRRPMTPLGKMAGQIAVAACLVFWGPSVDWIRDSAVGAAVAIVAVVALLNAVNFLDAIDGVVGAVLPILALGFVFLALVHAAPVDLALAWGLIGASAGFLVYNAPPARIFLGDAGSHLAGFLLAALALQSLEHGSSLPHLAALALLLATPLFDVAFVVVDRAARRRPIYVGGVDHPTHRLNRVLGPWGTIGIICGVAVLNVLVAIWVWGRPDPQSALAAVLVFGLAYAIFGAWLRRIGPTPRFDI